MAPNRDAGRDYGNRVTYAQAATILGCHISNVPKLVHDGKLTSTGQRNAALDRRQVEAVARERAQERAAAAARAEQRRTPAPDPRPPSRLLGHSEWLTCPEAADIIGITPQAVAKRLRAEKMPGVFHGGQWWVQAQHAWVAANVRSTQLRQSG